MSCSACGAAMPADGTFCPQCGAAASGPTTTTAGAVATAVLTGPATGDRRLRYGVIGGIGCLALFAFVLQAAALVLFSPSLAALLVSSMAAVLPVPLYAALILWLDRYEKEPGWLLFGAFFWGAVVATFFSLILNTLLGGLLRVVFGAPLAMMLAPPLLGPTVEETAKGLALLLIFLIMRHEFNNVTDGIIYGGLVGLGFAMTENVLYFGRAFAGGGLVGVGVNFLVRVIFGGFSHCMYTAATGAGFGLARESTRPLVKWLAPIGGYLVAMLLHFLWNFTAVVSGVVMNVHPLVNLLVVIPFMALLLISPGVVTLVALAYFTWRREARIIAAELRPEVESGVVSPAEYALLTGKPGARSKALWKVLLSRGPLAWHTVRQLLDSAADLAFRKAQAARGEKPWSFYRGESEAELRARIAALRQRLTVMGVALA